jgi:hypothetical protein
VEFAGPSFAEDFGYLLDNQAGSVFGCKEVGYKMADHKEADYMKIDLVVDYMEVDLVVDLVVDFANSAEWVEVVGTMVVVDSNLAAD